MYCTRTFPTVQVPIPEVPAENESCEWYQRPEEPLPL